MTASHEMTGVASRPPLSPWSPKSDQWASEWIAKGLVDTSAIPTQEFSQSMIGKGPRQKPKGRKYDYHLHRAYEIETLMIERHGPMLPETDDAVIYIKAVAYALNVWCRRNNGDLDFVLRGWCHRFCENGWALVRAAEVLGPILREMANVTNDLSADKVAKLLFVTEAERTNRPKIFRTIGACDLTREERLGNSRARKNENDRDRQANIRKLAGCRPQSTSAERNKPWAKLKMGRSTYYRRKAAGTLFPIGTSSSLICSSLLHGCDETVPRIKPTAEGEARRPVEDRKATVKLGGAPVVLADTSKANSSLQSPIANDDRLETEFPRKALRSGGANV